LSETIGNINVPKNEDYIDPRYLIQNTESYDDVRRLNVYEFMLYTYEGTEGYRDGRYLIPFSREAFYEDRRRTAAYKNLLKPIVDAMIDPVFENEIDRKSNNDLFDMFCENVDNSGTNMDSFSNMVITHAKLYGLTFVIMDNFEDVNITVKEAVDNRQYPYMYEKAPSFLHEIEIDDRGRIISITFLDDVIEINKVDTQTYRRWDRNESVLFYIKKSGGKDIEIILEERVHGLGEIPVIIVNYFLKNKNLSKLPSPPLYNLAMLVFQLYNKETYAQELEKYQAFSLLVGQGIDKKALSIGPTNFINVSDSVSNLPEYISPNTENLKTIVSNCDRLRDDIYNEAGQLGVYAVKGQQSGIAKEWDFRSEEQVLKNVSTASSKFEDDAAKLFGLYINANVEVDSKYPEDFSPQYFDQRVEILLNILKELPPSALADAIWQEIASIIFKQTPDKADEVIKEMMNTIDQSLKTVGDNE
jgi:hypothetical protein